jgi:hypothetical protein
LDLDWAPDHVLDDTRQLLGEAGLPVTIFATHSSAGVDRLRGLPRCEMGIHPNFLDEQFELARLLADFAGTTGVRCHALYYTSRLLPLFHRHGIRYFSNDLMFLQPHLAPYYDWSGLVRLPIYWEDDVHCEYFDGAFGLEVLRLGQPGLKVFNFHPVHLYLNTAQPEDYQAAKTDLADPVAARRHQRPGLGVRTLFLQLVRHLGGRSSGTLDQLAARFRTRETFVGLTARRYAGETFGKSASEKSGPSPAGRRTFQTRSKERG